MTIDKAIEILNESAHGRTTFNEDFREAELMGIEALKVCHRLGESVFNRTQDGPDPGPMPTIKR
jgi:hypothetical protein